MSHNETIFHTQTINEFCKYYNITQKELNESNINKFRHLCFKLNFFMKNIPLPNIIKNSLYEAVFIEFRCFPHIEFIIRNAIYKLGKEWSFTIICGSKNSSFIKNMTINISNNIKIITLDNENMTQQEYSNFLMTTKFWNLLTGDKIFIYQEDSLILKQNINPFLKYDYIGAPFPKNKDDTPNQVGNGGLSLRTKSKMLEVITNHQVSDLILGEATKMYMKMVNLKNPPEDVYFSKNLQEYKIGDVADWNTAYDFSSESVFNPNSFACHKLWVSTDKWMSHIEKSFNYEIYKANSNVKDYLIFIKKDPEMDQTSKNPSAFDIDLYFFCKVNNFEYYSKSSALVNFDKNGISGFIYHPKQIKKFFPKTYFLYFLHNIYIYYDKSIYNVQDFTNKHFYQSSFEYICDLSIKQKYNSLNDNFDIILLVFIGNETIGIDLINKIIQYKKKQKDFNVAFCLNVKIDDTTKIKSIIKKEFDFYVIYTCIDYGTDIIPTILMYNDIIKKHRFTHIIKLHTKRIEDIYNKLTKYLLAYPIHVIIKNKSSKCNCIGEDTCYISMKNDIYNKKLVSQHKTKIHEDYDFVGGTIFYTTDKVFDKVLMFIKKKNYRSYLLNNLYENNSINTDSSPIHFIERLFGVIKL